MAVNIEPSWLSVLAPEFEQNYMNSLRNFLQNEQAQHTTYPPNKLIFNAFNLTPFHDVKVVILGQDPYHGIGQAHRNKKQDQYFRIYFRWECNNERSVHCSGW
jgi:uracil-DNA glycosylase